MTDSPKTFSYLQAALSALQDTPNWQREMSTAPQDWTQNPDLLVECAETLQSPMRTDTTDIDTTVFSRAPNPTRGLKFAPRPPANLSPDAPTDYRDIRRSPGDVQIDVIFSDSPRGKYYGQPQRITIRKGQQAYRLDWKYGTCTLSHASEVPGEGRLLSAEEFHVIQRLLRSELAKTEEGFSAGCYTRFESNGRTTFLTAMDPVRHLKLMQFLDKSLLDFYEVSLEPHAVVTYENGEPSAVICRVWDVIVKIEISRDQRKDHPMEVIRISRHFGPHGEFIRSATSSELDADEARAVIEALYAVDPEEHAAEDLMSLQEDLAFHFGLDLDEEDDEDFDDEA